MAGGETLGVLLGSRREGCDACDTCYCGRKRVAVGGAAPGGPKVKATAAAMRDERAVEAAKAKARTEADAAARAGRAAARDE